MSATSLFTAFDKHLTPSQEDRDAALARVVACAAALTKHYWKSDDAVDHMTLIGSMVKGSSLRPIADVDVVFHLPAGTYTQFSEYSGNGQSALLQDVRSVLAARYPSTLIRGHGPVVLVEFATGASVELVPGVLYDKATILEIECYVPVTRDGGAWERGDYGAHHASFDKVNRARKGQLGRLVRYTKAWRREYCAVVKSLVLELMAIDFFSRWDTESSKTSLTYDDWLVRDFLAYMVKNQDAVYVIPGGQKRVSAGYGWRQDCAAALVAAKDACAADDESHVYIAEWRKVLGSAFGKP